MSSSLEELGTRYNTDKVGHGFLPFYEKHFAGLRSSKVNIMEIGVFYGASIRMWRDFFQEGEIWAVDWFTGLNGNGHVFNNPKSFIDEARSLDRVHVVECNQHIRTDLSEMSSYFKLQNIQLDSIIDDGSHLSQDQQQTLGELWCLVKPGGSFIIEDIHCSLDTSGYDNLPDFSNSTLTMLNRFQETKQISSPYLQNRECEMFQNEIESLQFYWKSGYPDSDGSVIITKKC